MIFNKENIANYLQSDKELMKADASALQIFVEQNPYSGFLQLIYCKFLHLHNDIKLEQQLEKCALVVADRNKVYEILFKKDLQQNIIEQESTSKETIITVLNSNINDEPNTTKIDRIKEETTEKNNKEINHFDELEQNILNEAINSSIQIDINDYATKETFTEENEDEELTIEVNKIEARTFVSWFDKPKTIKKTKSNSFVVDKFLKDPKNKEKISSTILSPSEMAKLSLVANNQFVTETLATIYAKQGQIDKAIEIYEQLSLKNPEKKTFFASRIRFLKEKQQYNK